MSKKKPRKEISPVTNKIPRTDPTIKSSFNQNPTWHIGKVDLEGPWRWTQIENEYFFKKILPKIQYFESMFWKDILGRNNHEVYVSQICRLAQKRLVDLNLDDIDTLVSLRLTGKQRVWGIKAGNTFKILWWDPNHEVYPSKMKHT